MRQRSRDQLGLEEPRRRVTEPFLPTRTLEPPLATPGSRVDLSGKSWSEQALVAANGPQDFVFCRSLHVKSFSLNPKSPRAILRS